MWIGLAALLSSVAGAHGEEPPELRPGARVRVSMRQQSQRAGEVQTVKLVGRLLDSSESAVTLEGPDRSPLVLQRQQIERLEVSLRRSQRKKGALIGLGVGFLLGAALVTADSSECPPPEEVFLCLDFSGPEYAAAGGVLAGAGGALIGALAAPGEKWGPVGSHRAQVLVGPARGGGVRFGVSFGF
jgi:hypothetical protein